MKTGILKKLIACFLITAMMVCGPFANVPKNAFAAGDDTASGAAVQQAEADEDETEDTGEDGEKDEADKSSESDDQKESDDSKLYISEVKLGMGKTEEEAAKALVDAGFFIMQKDGKPVDLNKGASDERPRVIYLGYKTTTDPNDGITDLAVMNMTGGYSFSDYDELINKAMETQVKPFVENFLATINEYRENYNKPKNTPNHKRADIVRQILNKFTDDDTDGAPIGDLLLNETKYEMGDKAYEELPEVDKKDTLDIVTMFLQGNLTSISLIEKFLVKAADSSDSTWVERFENTSYDQLVEEFEKKYLDADLDDIHKKMDKKYNDTAKQILELWDDFADVAENYEDKKDEIENSIEDTKEKLEEATDIDAENMNVDELADSIVELNDAQVDAMDMVDDSVAVNASAELDEKENEDGNLREFFAQPAANFQGDGIRKLYPVVASLSEGQIAGIQFLSLQELIDAGLNSIENLEQEMIKDVETVSVYEGVNREIFEKGAVAMTSAALRQEALTQGNDLNPVTKTRIMGIAMLAAGAACGVAFGALLKPLYIKIEGLNYVGNKLMTYAKDLAQGKKTIITVLNSKGKSFTGYTAEGLTERAKNFFNGVKVWKTALVVLSVAAVVLIVVGLINTINGIKNDGKAFDYEPIPKYIVDEADITRFNEKGEKEFYRNDTAYYRVVECNRKDLLGVTSTQSKEDNEFLKKRVEENGDKGDLNGDDGRQWLALYTVKYEQSTPILADSLMVKTGADSSTPPDGYTTGIHMFGEKNAYNLNNPKLIREEKAEEIRVFFKQDKEAFKKDVSVNKADKNDDKLTETGSLTSDRSVILYLVIGFAAGMIVVWLITFFLGRRKRTQLPSDEE